MHSIQQPSDDETPTALVTATQVLANRVQGLADVVAINNTKIDGLQHEVNQKPDDVEVRTLTQIGDKERKVIRDRVLFTCILFSIVAGIVAFWVAETAGHERCIKNQRNIETISDYLETRNDAMARATARSLRENRNPC